MLKLTSTFALFLILFVLQAQELPEQFREPFSESYSIRKEQHLEIKAYVNEVLKERIDTALNKFQPDFFSIESYESSLYPYRKAAWRSFRLPAGKSNGRQNYTF
jgi:hypothetical protein